MAHVVVLHLIELFWAEFGVSSGVQNIAEANVIVYLKLLIHLDVSQGFVLEGLTVDSGTLDRRKNRAGGRQRPVACL